MDCSSIVDFVYDHLCLVLLANLCGICLYQFVIRDWCYFSDRNVKFLREWPGVKIFWQAFFATDQLKSIPAMLCDTYMAFPHERLFGIFEFGGNPVYFLRDPELIKQIAIKDSDHFRNHRFTIDETSDPMIGRSLFFMKDTRWRQMRPMLTPLFTGRKMRIMFDIIDGKSKQFVDYLQASNGEGSGGVLELDMKDVFNRYATDVIASCAFGLEVNSLEHRTNEFYTMAKVVSNFDGWRGAAFAFFIACPRLAKLCRVSIVGDTYRKYFTELVMSVVRHRREQGIVREDIINLLMKLSDELKSEQSDGKLKWTDDDLVAQCMGFFLAGYDPVANMMSFMAHEITVNPHVQQKLYEEIQTSKQTNGTQLTFDVLNELSYLDAVASESLRKWTPTPATDRCVNRPYDVQLGDGGHTLRLRVGDVVTIPIHAIHMDAAYHPDPEEFRPERFLGSGKAELVAAGTFMPFGVGARNCLGSRFAIMEAKLAIYHLLDRYTLVNCNRTQHPLRLKPLSASMLTEQGIWMRLEPRIAG